MALEWNFKVNRQTLYGHKLRYYCEDNWMYWEMGGCSIRYIYSTIFNVKHKTVFTIFLE